MHLERLAKVLRPSTSRLAVSPPCRSSLGELFWAVVPITDTDVFECYMQFGHQCLLNGPVDRSTGPLGMNLVTQQHKSSEQSMINLPPIVGKKTVSTIRTKGIVSILCHRTNYEALDRHVHWHFGRASLDDLVPLSPLLQEPKRQRKNKESLCGFMASPSAQLCCQDVHSAQLAMTCLRIKNITRTLAYSAFPCSEQQMLDI
eukprot:3895195-Amphidinium_carterae.1